MATIPPGYPHSVSDDEILRVLSELANDIFQAGANINTTLQLGPLVSAGQNELATRNMKRGMDELRSAVDTFRASSHRASTTLIVLTAVLVVLTIVLTVATIALLAE